MTRWKAEAPELTVAGRRHDLLVASAVEQPTKWKIQQQSVACSADPITRPGYHRTFGLVFIRQSVRIADASHSR